VAAPDRVLAPVKRWIARLSAREQNIAAALVYLAGMLCLFVTAPHNGEFAWSDAPRHALNGVFVQDFIRAVPYDPRTWAMQYYVKYPALTILFYPPLFYLISAPFYAVLGVSHATALAVVLVHYFALALGLYFIARLWLDWASSLAVGLAALGAPAIALWGRQVMLDVPVTAFAVWSVLAGLHYLRSQRPQYLYAAIVLLLCAVYTKLNAAFLFIPLAIAILAQRKLKAFRDRQIWFAALFAVLGMIPAIVLTLRFGAANVQSVVDTNLGIEETGRLARWLWYGQHVPETVGWPIAILAAAFPILWILGRRPKGMTGSQVLLLAGWYLTGYVMLSIIELKEVRDAVIIAPALVLFAALAWRAAAGTASWSSAVFLMGAIAIAATTIIFDQVPRVTGYREAASWIAQHAPRGAVVVFSGERDGSYIWNMRTMQRRPDVTTLRSDKLLLSISVTRLRGVKAKDYSEPQIASMLDNDGISYVVAQDDFWQDIPVMKRFDDLLHSSHFREVYRIATTSNVPVRDKVLRIYKNEDPINRDPKGIQLDLPVIDQQIHGSLTGSN
jgi:4-amino-4-deoxy-L-arabinose transferase-like glycosyltransferase